MPGRANSPYAQSKCSVRSGRGEQCDELQEQESSLRAWWRSDWRGRSPSTPRRRPRTPLPAPRRRPPSARRLRRRVPPRRRPRRRVPPLQRQPPSSRAAPSSQAPVPAPASSAKPDAPVAPVPAPPAPAPAPAAPAPVAQGLDAAGIQRIKDSCTARLQSDAAHSGIVTGTVVPRPFTIVSIAYSGNPVQSTAASGLASYDILMKITTKLVDGPAQESVRVCRVYDSDSHVDWLPAG